MGAKAAGQFPYPLNRIQLWTVRRKKIEAEEFAVFPQPRLKESGVVITRIIEDYHHLPSPPITTHHLLKKGLKTVGVELFFVPKDQPSVRFTYCPEHRDAFPCGGMKKDWVTHFWRDPHQTARTMLLKVAFVFKPYFNVFASCEAQEFFYIAAGHGGQHGQ